MAAEMDEVVEIADRIVVLADLAVAGDHANSDLDLKLVLAQVAGQSTTTNGQAATQ
jgi:simple sugar transport system ATP-binding protein